MLRATESKRRRQTLAKSGWRFPQRKRRREFSALERRTPSGNSRLLRSAWTRDVSTRTVYGKQYSIHRYRPRVEGLFARIERWVNIADPRDTFWRSISKDNITTWYGKTSESRIADPDDPSRVFTWLICESYDDKGNVICYQHKAENSEGVDLSQACERNRTDASRSANRYVKHIFYGNLTPYFPDLTAEAPVSLPTDRCFELVFDYGEHDLNAPLPQETGTWVCRSDPFSTYRATFEVRTYRICRRALMFHHFKNEKDVGANCLVRSTDLTHAQPAPAPPYPIEPFYSYLSAVTQTGYLLNADGSYLSKSLPPVEFTYTEATIDETVRDVDLVSLENLAYGLDGKEYQWVDLNGEGLSGILTEQARSWFYKPNLSPANLRTEDGEEVTLARFEPMNPVALGPSLAALGGGGQHLLDLSGEGRQALVQYDGPTPGFFERTEDEEWRPFQTFPSLPTLDWQNPNLKFIDLTGDGFPDLLISEDNAFWWHTSYAKAGFGPGQRAPRALDDEKGPKLIFFDSTQTIFLADMSGDGLTDIVRIRNGEVCYWPNKGYGRFGTKVTMDQAPWFETPDFFDGRRIQLADIDGSGAADIVYFASKGVQLYFNQSGNGWGAMRPLSVFPRVESVSPGAAMDLLGNGTACLVWSSPLPGSSRRPMRYVDLMAAGKPHLLVRVTNNLGAETRVQYAPSTKFYAEDKLAETPWVTRLPFPVHVVERVETYDWTSRNRFATRYAYHHGYYDGVEREFRGFGRVDQWDTAEFATLADTNDFPAVNLDTASNVPPALTMTWFHTGAYFGEGRISKHLAHEYYREGDEGEGIAGLSEEQFEAMQLDDTIVPTTVLLPDGSRQPREFSPEEYREACRALRGSILRQEVYGLDGADAADRPYGVSERNYTVEVLQPRGPNKYGAFFSHARETLDFHYERKLFKVVNGTLVDPGAAPANANDFADPRVTHAVTFAVDQYGNVLQSAAVAYGRRFIDPAITPQDQAKQSATLCTYAENSYTNAVLQDDSYRTPLPAEALSYELIRIQPDAARANVTNLFRFEELQTKVRSASDGHHDIAYENLNPSNLQTGQTYRRMTGRTRALSGPSSPGELNQALRSFFLTRRVEDPFGNATSIDYDAYNLLVAKTVDAAGNTIAVVSDYRVLAPYSRTDPNGNQTEVSFDVLGLVVASAVMGNPGQNLGDLPTGFSSDLSRAQIDSFHDANDPHSLAPALLGNATTRIVYDMDRFYNSRTGAPNDPTQWLPTFAATLTRETHAADPVPSGGLKIQISFSYSDGFGREIEKKIQSEPGPVVDGGPTVNPRWVGSGWTIFNNKGKPVRKYEPFFSQLPKGHQFEFGVQVGVSPILCYDPVERVVATIHPNHTYEKVVFDPWGQATWDVNDTVMQDDPTADPDVGDFFKALPAVDYSPSWRVQRAGGALGAQEQDAANKAALHANTPTTAYLDTLGRTFLTVANNGKDAGGKATRSWDSRGHNFRTQYDALRRPTGMFVLGTDAVNSDSRTTGGEVLYEKITYGEGQPAGLNMRTRIFQHADAAGMVTNMGTNPVTNQNEGFDFKGNLLRGSRALVADYKKLPDWSTPPPTPESFDSSTQYDALNRPIALTTPDGSTIRPAYNEANLLESETVNLRGAAAVTPFVTNIDYNARGQRVLIEYGNGANTIYQYDPLTFRMIQLITRRNTAAFPNDCPQSPPADWPGCQAQNLSYTYDPAGNITFISDDAQQTIFFNNQRVEPSADYTYDPIYRLVQATGREHLGVNGNGRSLPPTPTSYNDFPRVGLFPNPNDGNAMGTYSERYLYDPAGNFQSFTHKGAKPASPGWTRSYTYNEKSLIEPGQVSNRLTGATVSGNQSFNEPYTYDLHGNMTSMPQLQTMQWDFKDQLDMTQRQVVNLNDQDGLLHKGERTYYVYDAGGQRVRKTTESATGAKVKERYYLRGFEVYREYNSTGAVTVQRETLHVMNDKKRIALVETTTIDTSVASRSLPSTAIGYQFDNHLGTAVLELDETGAVITYEEYYPYGSTSYQAGRSAAEVGLKRYRYTWKERDEESGLYYHGARYYSPWLARWAAADPIGVAGGKDLYTYAMNNPVILADPNGTQPHKPKKHPAPKHDPPKFAAPSIPDFEDKPSQKTISWGGRSVDAYFFPGTSQETFLIVGGVHQDEKNALKLSNELLTELQGQKNKPYYNIVFIPDLFHGRGIDPGSHGDIEGTPTNRNFPAQDKSLADSVKKGRPKDEQGRNILPENVILIAVAEKFRPAASLSIHSHGPTKESQIDTKGAASVTVDPKAGDEAKADFITTGAALAAKKAGTPVPGNRVDEAAETARTRYPNSTAPAAPGVTFGNWGSHRDGMNQYLIETEGYTTPKARTENYSGWVPIVQDKILADPADVAAANLARRWTPCWNILKKVYGF